MLIRILKCRPNTHKFPIASWAIRLFEGVDYSHFAIEIGPVVLDATSSDVRFSGKKSFYKKYKVTGQYELLIRESMEQVIWWASVHLNKSYGYLQILGLALIHLGILKKNPFGKDADILICNELVLLFLRDFKFVDKNLLENMDNYGLVATDEILKDYAYGQKNN